MSRRVPLLLASALAVVPVVGADAAFPGRNGRIAFEDGGAIVVARADGRGARRLTAGGDDETPAWSPGGTRIAFARVEEELTSSSGSIAVVRPNGRGLRIITNVAGESDVVDVAPSWSPGGRLIAFGRSAGAAQSDIWVVSPTGTRLRALTTHAADDSDPAWSPDGRRIAFESDRDGNNEVYVMRADGSGARRLTANAASDGDPAWSPDGRRIVFESNRAGNDDIFVMNRNGSRVRRLTRTASDDSDPAWSPDGRRILFESDRAGGDAIYSMTTRGRGVRRVTRGGGSDPDWERRRR